MTPALACVFFLRIPGKSYCIITKKAKEKTDWVEMINKAKADLLAIRDASSYAKSVRVGTSQRRPSSIRRPVALNNMPSSTSAILFRGRPDTGLIHTQSSRTLREDHSAYNGHNNTNNTTNNTTSDGNKTIPQEEKNGQAHVTK
mgnify:CR=1 FL=1